MHKSEKGNAIKDLVKLDVGEDYFWKGHLFTKNMLLYLDGYLDYLLIMQNSWFIIPVFFTPPFCIRS